MKYKNNEYRGMIFSLIVSLLIVPVIGIYVASPSKKQVNNTSFVERAFDKYFEEEIGCSPEEFTKEISSVDITRKD